MVRWHEVVVACCLVPCVLVTVQCMTGRFVTLQDCKLSSPLFEQLLKSRLQSKARVLEIGCGTSSLAADLWDMGFRDITACDYLEAPIRAQQERQVGSGRKVVYEVMDMRQLTQVADGTFDLVIDKGAIDALVCASAADAKKGAQELWRVLKVNILLFHMSCRCVGLTMGVAEQA